MSAAVQPNYWGTPEQRQACIDLGEAQKLELLDRLTEIISDPSYSAAGAAIAIVDWLESVENHRWLLVWDDPTNWSGCPLCGG